MHSTPRGRAFGWPVGRPAEAGRVGQEVDGQGHCPQGCLLVGASPLWRGGAAAAAREQPSPQRLRVLQSRRLASLGVFPSAQWVEAANCHSS